MIPESITVIYNDHVPLAPRLGQTGLRVTASSTPSVPAVLPGVPGDILSVANTGAYDIHFRMCKEGETLVRAANTDTIVWAGRDLLFLVPSADKLRPAARCAISVICPEGAGDVVFTTYERGT